MRLGFPVSLLRNVRLLSWAVSGDGGLTAQPGLLAQSSWDTPRTFNAFCCGHNEPCISDLGYTHM